VSGYRADKMISALMWRSSEHTRKNKKDVYDCSSYFISISWSFNEFNVDNFDWFSIQPQQF
jgi:hypothetical protein